jgi:hypothetical protein
VLQIHETIPLQIFDPFAELFEVGHTVSAHGSNAQIVAWVNERSVAQDVRVSRPFSYLDQPNHVAYWHKCEVPAAASDVRV